MAASGACACADAGGVGATILAKEMEAFIPAFVWSEFSRDRLVVPPSLAEPEPSAEAELGVDVDVDGEEAVVAECEVGLGPPSAGNSSTESRCTLG